MGFEGIQAGSIFDFVSTPAAPPPPPPPPAPPPPAPVASYRTTDSGKQIPIGQFGNRLDTAAGAKKEAEMAAAAHALKVAHSEAVHGRPESAQVALEKAQQHTAAANTPAGGAFQQAVARDTSNINQIIEQSKTSPPPGQPPQPPVNQIPEDPVKSSSFSSPGSSSPSSPSVPAKPVVKTPIKDIINLEPMIRDASEISAILFNQLSSTELTKIVRHDTVSGKRILYSPVSDLQRNDTIFDPSIILSNKSSYDSIFNGFQIKLESKLPDENTYELNDENNYPENSLLENAYWDGENLIIELKNITSTELVEIELEQSGKIYKVRENDNQ